MRENRRTLAVVLGFSGAAAAVLALLLWLDVTRGFDERVVVAWEHLYERLALLLATPLGLGPRDALLAAFVAVDVVLVAVLLACAYAWGRSGLATGAFAWLPSWLAPLWVASGMSGSVFKSRAMAALSITASPADGLEYQRAWKLVQPEAFVFLAVGLVAGFLGWWFGRRRAGDREIARNATDDGE